MSFLSSIRIVRVVLALAVASWMAGAGCMLGCANMVSAAAPSEFGSPASPPTIVAAGGACAAMHAHDCCARRAAKSARKSAAKAHTATTTSALGPELSATPGTMMDCPLAVNATAALSKATPDQSSIALPPSVASALLSNSSEQTTAFARPFRLPNRGHTYLRCCVFLI